MTVVNVDAPILDLDDKPIEGVFAKKLIVEALMAPLEGDDKITGEQKIKLFLLAQRFQVGGEVDLTSDEITSVKARVARAWNNLVTGRIWELLDPASVK